jgi:hypothetical protein
VSQSVASAVEPLANIVKASGGRSRFDLTRKMVDGIGYHTFPFLSRGNARLAGPFRSAFGAILVHTTTLRRIMADGPTQGGLGLILLRQERVGL